MHFNLLAQYVIQEYSKRTFLRPCYHSYCFTCIRHWINIASSVCPVCRQQVDSLIYNIDDEENTFDEYHLKDKGTNKTHDPPLYPKRRYTTPEERLRLERSQIYKGTMKATSYPAALPQHIDLVVITPEYIPRVRRCSIFALHDDLSNFVSSRLEFFYSMN